MTIRLRDAPPRPHSQTWRRRMLLGAGLGALTVAAVGWQRSCSVDGTDRAPVRIEWLDAAAAEALLPPRPKPFLNQRRIVAYYGNPLAPQMGILGEYEPEEVVRRLRAQADVYQRLSPDRTVVPALHFIYAVAQERPGPEGLYLLRMDDELVWRWVQLAQEHGMLLVLGVQLGRSTIDREFAHVAPFLTEENVHLALDPEFAWGPEEYPLVDIGHVDGATVNRAQELLERLIIERRLPNKVLIVHQFRPDMLTNKAAIRPSDWVETVIDADGLGSSSLKLDQWNRVIRQDNVARAGIKLFYKQDAQNGGLMSEADVMGLTPAPLVIIYQ
jgi:hypothetical protein